jgi:hypothetical protein
MSGLAKALELTRRQNGEVLMPAPAHDHRLLCILHLVPNLGEVLSKVAIAGRSHKAPNPVKLYRHIVQLLDRWVKMGS